MKTGSPFTIGLVGLSLILLGACSTSEETTPLIATPEILPTPARTVEDAKPRTFVIRASIATANALRSMGLTTAEQTADWYTEPWPQDDPFVDSIRSQLRTAQSKAADAASLQELDLGAATLAVLDIYGIRTPAELSSFDLARLDDGRRCEQVCRAEIATAMLREGWSCLNASVTNRPRASQLLIDGRPLGRLFASNRAASRRFLTRLPRTLWDQSRIVTLSVDVASPRSGLPPVRWFRDIELTRGAVNQ